MLINLFETEAKINSIQAIFYSKKLENRDTLCNKWSYSMWC